MYVYIDMYMYVSIYVYLYTCMSICTCNFGCMSVQGVVPCLDSICVFDVANGVLITICSICVCVYTHALVHAHIYA